MRVRNVLVRRLVPLDALDRAVLAFETALDQPARLRFAYPEKRLGVAQVGPVLLIGGDEDALDPFRATAMTFLVDDVTGYSAWLPTTGAEIVRPVTRVPSGRNMLVRHADGALIEYVEHDHPDPADDVLTPAPDGRADGSSPGCRPLNPA